MKQGNAQALKRMNRRIVLRALRELAPTTRPELAAKTHLSHSTVSSVIEDLLAEQLVKQTGKGAPTGGRKPILVDFNEGKYYFVCVECALDAIRVALVNLKFEVVNLVSREVTKPPRSAHFLELLVGLTRQLLASLDQDDVVLGMVVGVGGVVNRQKDTIIYSAAYEITNLNVLRALADVFHFPIYAENDANLCALAERRFLGARTYVYLLIGPSIGSGIIIDGELYVGASGWAGEIGHVIVDPEGPRCFCGRKGCLIAGLSRYIPIATSKELEARFAAIQQGNIDKDDSYRQFCDYLALAIANYVEVIDPELVVIGGVLARVAPDRLYEDLERRINGQLLMTQQAVSILPSSHKENAVILGGAHYCFDSTLLS